MEHSIIGALFFRPRRFWGPFLGVFEFVVFTLTFTVHESRDKYREFYGLFYAPALLFKEIYRP